MRFLRFDVLTASGMPVLINSSKRRRFLVRLPAVTQIMDGIGGGDFGHFFLASSGLNRRPSVRLPRAIRVLPLSHKRLLFTSFQRHLSPATTVVLSSRTFDHLLRNRIFLG